MDKKYICIICLIACVAMSGCRENITIISGEEEQHGVAQQTDITGFYLLNEGNMGSNKSTLDFYDFTTATYRRNIYAEANHNVPKELGDVGNDIQIYGNRLYAVINCSNKVEVLDARTCHRIGQIDVPNCRYLRFHEGYGYLTSYAGPVVINPNYEQIGYVAKFDTATLTLVDTCHVGFQPDGLEVVSGNIFVANSGGYMVPNYENTLSVIDLQTFNETQRIPIAVNLHRVSADKYGQLWVSSRGDYYTTPSRLYCINPLTRTITDSVETAVSNFCIVGDSLYFYATEWSYVSMQDSICYGIIDVKTHKILPQSFITDGTDKNIKKPYGIAVHPITREVYVTDAKNYVTPGMLHCYSPQGILQWSVRTGDIPAHFAFLTAKK